MYVCHICPVDELISKLPGKVTPDNQNQVKDQLDEILALYNALSASDQKKVDLTLYNDLQKQLSLADARTDKLYQDRSEPVPFDVSLWLNFNVNGFTYTGTKTTAFQVQAPGTLFLVGSGTIKSEKGAGIEVLSGGFLSIDGQNSDLVISGSTFGLYVSAGATVRLSGGTFIGNTAAIRTADGDFGALLETGYAYFDADGAPVPEANLATAKTIVVKACTDHPGKTYTQTSGATTHTWYCAACKTEGTEPCTFVFTDGGKGVCGLCGNEITIAVDRNSLKTLAYDQTSGRRMVPSQSR